MCRIGMKSSYRLGARPSVIATSCASLPSTAPSMCSFSERWPLPSSCSPSTTPSLHRDYVAIMNDLSGGNPGEKQARGILGYFGRAFNFSPHRLVQLGFAVTAYGALEACEMVGLWLNKRWAEYLTFVATTLLVPFEVYELTLGVSAFKVVTIVINVAIVVYLLLAKRLFGLRGGYQAERERRRVLSGWDAVERATPGFGVPLDRA